MNYTNCCNAPFGNPGWPDCDICSDCYEHAEPIEEENEYVEPYETNLIKLRVIRDNYSHEDKRLHCEEKESNDNPFGLQDL